MALFTSFTDGELRNISVKVLSVPVSGNMFTRENECGYISMPALGSEVQNVSCSPIKTGRYVQIQKNALSSQIALCEVKVYGFKCKFIPNSDLSGLMLDKSFFLCKNIINFKRFLSFR